MHAIINALIALCIALSIIQRENETQNGAKTSAKRHSSKLHFKVISLWDLMGFVYAGCRLSAPTADPLELRGLGIEKKVSDAFNFFCQMSLKVWFRGYLHMCAVLDLYDFLYRQGEKG